MHLLRFIEISTKILEKLSRRIFTNFVEKILRRIFTIAIHLTILRKFYDF